MEGDPIRLLLVDDERAFVDVLYNRFTRKGLAVTKAYSGTEAIRILRSQDFDVSILDLKMEDMDGIEVLKIFKKMLPSMAVIMRTGHGSERAAKAGIAGNQLSDGAPAVDEAKQPQDRYQQGQSVEPR